MAPEYAMHGHLSAKADVYSFGSLLLELMSGRKNVDFNLSLEMPILLEWVRYRFHYIFNWQYLSFPGHAIWFI